MKFEKEKKEIIFWAKLLNERGFVTARSGNISLRAGDNKILISSHDSHLGFLETKEILLTDLDSNVLEGDLDPAVEKDLHTGIYKSFDDVNAVIHSHAPFTTAFFHYFDSLDLFSFESRFYLGEVPTVPQHTPTVTDVGPVMSALKNSSIVVLQNHGVVSVGENFKSAFGLMEVLEEQAKVNLALKAIPITREQDLGKKKSKHPVKKISSKRYRLLSKEHSERLMEIVNNDDQVQELGKQHDLTCTLAVKNKDSGDVSCFFYEEGKIVKINNNENADFLIIGKKDILRKVFNREIDPFVATTQGKVTTQGDFAKMSRWYPVMVRTFELWARVPVE